jgi:hypothetical protein
MYDYYHQESAYHMCYIFGIYNENYLHFYISHKLQFINILNLELEWLHIYQC